MVCETYKHKNTIVQSIQSTVGWKAITMFQILPMEAGAQLPHHYCCLLPWKPFCGSCIELECKYGRTELASADLVPMSSVRGIPLFCACCPPRERIGRSYLREYSEIPS